MKRTITTAGLAALGAASFAPAFAQDAMVSQRPWSVGAAIKGFYDDNLFTYPGVVAPGINLPELDTFGFEVSPSAAYNWKQDQTSVGVSYLYTMRYYADRPRPRDDHAHQANVKLSHAFNERYSVDVKDSFVVAQEPSILDPTISTTAPARSEGDNTRNAGSFQFNANVAEQFGLVLGYSNTIYDYEQDADDTNFGGFPIGVGSRSAVLDRMEHLFFVDGNYELNPKTTLSVGYQFGINDYTSEDLLFGPFTGDVRDSKSHFVSGGVRHHLNPQVDLSAKAGVQITTYSSALFDDVVGPYAEGSARWQYMEGSSLQVGVRHQRTPTDVRLVAGTPIADAESTSVYASVTHAITARISAIAMAQYQHSTYGESTPGGAVDVGDDLFYGGVTVAYQFNTHVAAEIGYSYDRLDSDLGLRSFTRNRVFIGTRLNY
jgi:hypothetical protein